jgi:hypothetical protein
VGTDGTQVVATGEDDTVALTTSQVVIGVGCTLQLRDGDDIGLDDHNSGDDDTVRYFGKVQLPLAGQSCTLPGDGNANVTLVVSDGLVTTWRAGPDGSMDLSLTGTTAGGGSITYRFSGFR